MEYLHTMVRISDIDASLDFYCNNLGMVEMNRTEVEKGRFTLIFLAAPDDVERALGPVNTSRGRRVAAPDAGPARREEGV